MAGQRNDGGRSERSRQHENQQPLCPVQSLQEKKHSQDEKIPKNYRAEPAQKRHRKSQGKQDRPPEFAAKQNAPKPVHGQQPIKDGARRAADTAQPCHANFKSITTVTAGREKQINKPKS